MKLQGDLVEEHRGEGRALRIGDLPQRHRGHGERFNRFAV
jgi:hypothetical protein